MFSRYFGLETQYLEQILSKNADKILNQLEKQKMKVIKEYQMIVSNSIIGSRNH